MGGVGESKQLGVLVGCHDEPAFGIILAAAEQPRRATGEVIKRAFEQAGVLFIDADGGGPGVRLSKA